MKLFLTIATSAWGSYWHLLDKPLSTKQGLFRTAYKVLVTLTLYLLAMALVSSLIPRSPIAPANSSSTSTTLIG